MESKKIQFFNKLSFVTLLSTLFLALFFFIPYIPVTLEASKGFLISIGTTLALFFWLIAQLGEGKFSLPKDKILLYAGAIPLVFLVASFFSPSKYVSFFGSGFEIGTFGSMLVMYILFFLSSIYFQSEKRLWYFYSVFLLGASILSLFELINMFIGFNRFAPGLLNGISSGNLVGSWNDFVLLFGLIIILSLFTIEFLKTKGFFRVLQYFLLASGIFFLIVINLPLVWTLVGLFSIILFVYSISIQHSGHKEGQEENANNNRKFPFTTLIVIFLCLIFLVGHNSIGSLISNYISVSNPSVRPLFSTTAEIAYKAILHNPVFGTGPNTFVMDWSLWQPKQVAQSIFWNVDFTSGYSTLTTFVVTTGLLGLAAWLLFLIAFFKRGLESLRKILGNPFSNYFTMMTLITSIYSWIILAIFTPNIIMLMIAFVSSGMLIGLLVYNQTITVRNFSFLNDPRSSFFSILGLMVLMIATLSTTYLYAEKFASIIYYSKGSSVSGTTMDDLNKAQRMLSNALLLDQNDIYYRTLSQIYVNQIGVLVNDKTVSQDALKSSLQQLINLAENSSQSAINQNPKQYLNYLNQGNVYSNFVPLSVTGSYDSATASYVKAGQLAPNNPSILLARASLEIANKSNDNARNFISQALAIKPDYTDAIFLLAQIDTNEGNLTDAIKQAELASQLAPNDSTVFFRLGLLRYNNSDYAGAVSAFEQAVILDPTYLNARYFLGESYAKVGRNSDAMIQFNILNKAVPNNPDVQSAINALSSGGTTTPSTTTPPATNNTKTNVKTTTPPTTTLPKQ